MMASFLKILNASTRFPLLAGGAGPHLVLLCHGSDVFRFQVATKLPVWKKKKLVIFEDIPSELTVSAGFKIALPHTVDSNPGLY